MLESREGPKRRVTGGREFGQEACAAPAGVKDPGSRPPGPGADHRRSRETIAARSAAESPRQSTDGQPFDAASPGFWPTKKHTTGPKNSPAAGGRSTRPGSGPRGTGRRAEAPGPITLERVRSSLAPPCFPAVLPQGGNHVQAVVPHRVGVTFALLRTGWASPPLTCRGRNCPPAAPRAPGTGQTDEKCAGQPAYGLPRTLAARVGR